MRVLTMGEVLVALRADRIGPLHDGGALTVGVAGAEANVAIGLQRLGVGAELLTKVGGDPFGRIILDCLRREGVAVRGGVVPDLPTGILIAERRTADLRRISYRRSGSAASTLSAADLDDVEWESIALLHVTGITAALSASARDLLRTAVATAAERGVPVSIDVNHRTALWSHAEAADFFSGVIDRCDTVFASADELGLLGAATGGELMDRGVDEVVITDGAAGARGWERDVPSRHQPALAGTVVDTVGAGDAFVSGYLAAKLGGLPLEERLRRGAISAACCVSTQGDWEGLPTAAEVASGTFDRATDTLR